MPWREAARLDWRLLWRSRTQSSGELWAVIALALMAVVTAGGTSFDLGQQLASNDLGVGPGRRLVDLQVWGAFLAAWVFVITTGQLSFMRRLVDDLSTRPVSRGQAFLALQAISVAGRQSLALPSIGLPLLLLFWNWLDGAALIAAVAAALLLLRLPVAVLAIGTRFASASMPIALAGALAIAATIGAFWLTAPAVVMAWLPPFLVTRVLMNEAPASAWAGLAIWTMTLAAIDYGTMALEAAPVPARSRTLPPYRALPATVRLLAVVTGCLPVVLHGELVRLSRWRRYQLSWLMGAVLMVAVGSRLSDRPGLLTIVILLMIPVHVGGSMLANLFAADNAGFVAMVMSPLNLGAVIRAKVIAALLFTVVAELAGVAFLIVYHGEWEAIAVGGALAAGLFMWNAAIGIVTSVLFPSASDPHTVGGSMVSNPAAIVIVAGGALYVGLALRLAFLFESHRVTLEAGVLAGLALIAFAVAAFVAMSHLAPRLAAPRVEAMIAALTATPGTRT